MKNRIFLPLLLVLSATAFSASAMAASDSPPPHQIIQNTLTVAGRHYLLHLFVHHFVTNGQMIY
ncbi:TPA: PagK family vesicle-borne virulence factor [Salmonella enterica]|nr:hypothetical protein [Salmonella enterica subsp. enterica]